MPLALLMFGPDSLIVEPRGLAAASLSPTHETPVSSTPLTGTARMSWGKITPIENHCSKAVLSVRTFSDDGNVLCLLNTTWEPSSHMWLLST